MICECVRTHLHIIITVYYYIGRKKIYSRESVGIIVLLLLHFFRTRNNYYYRYTLLSAAASPVKYSAARHWAWAWARGAKSQRTQRCARVCFSLRPLKIARPPRSFRVRAVQLSFSQRLWGDDDCTDYESAYTRNARTHNTRGVRGVLFGAPVQSVGPAAPRRRVTPTGHTRRRRRRRAYFVLLLFLKQRGAPPTSCRPSAQFPHLRLQYYYPALTTPPPVPQSPPGVMYTRIRFIIIIFVGRRVGVPRREEGANTAPK